MPQQQFVRLETEQEAITAVTLVEIDSTSCSRSTDCQQSCSLEEISTFHIADYLLLLLMA